jgi:hypothetical protein
MRGASGPHIEWTPASSCTGPRLIDFRHVQGTWPEAVCAENGMSFYTASVKFGKDQI